MTSYRTARAAPLSARTMRIRVLIGRLREAETNSMRGWLLHEIANEVGSSDPAMREACLLLRDWFHGNNLPGDR